MSDPAQGYGPLTRRNGGPEGSGRMGGEAQCKTTDLAVGVRILRCAQQSQRSAASSWLLVVSAATTIHRSWRHVAGRRVQSQSRRLKSRYSPAGYDEPTLRGAGRPAG